MRLPDRTTRLATIACALLALAPFAAMTEGAVKRLECTVNRVCDAQGRCRPEQAALSFRMEPQELGVGGSGEYLLSYGDISVAMQAMSDAGPFLWKLDTERNALLASSETEWLWHRLTLEPVPGSTIRFLTCAFQQ